MSNQRHLSQRGNTYPTRRDTTNTFNPRVASEGGEFRPFKPNKVDRRDHSSTLPLEVETHPQRRPPKKSGRNIDFRTLQDTINKLKQSETF